MNSLKENWFSEIDEELWPGHCFSLKCDQLLYNKKSKYQDVLVFNKFERMKFIILYINFLLILVKHLVTC